MRAPFAPPRLSVPRNDAADAQAVETSWETDSPEARTFALRSAMSRSLDQFVVYVRDGVLPQLAASVRDQRTDIPAAGPHVPVDQLEPGPGEGVFKGLRVLKKALCNLRVNRVHPQ